MGIFSRLADIINANLNTVLARAENPEKMVRLMVREMEETLVEVRATAARLIADRKGLERRLARLAESREDWRRKAELAVLREREDLARAALVQKARIDDSVKVLEEELAQLGDALAAYEADIAKLEAKLAEARAKQKAIVARETTASHRAKVKRQLHDRRLDDAFARFEQMERRVDSAEAELESLDLGRGRGLEAELAALEVDARIEDELDAIRARLRVRRESGDSAR